MFNLLFITAAQRLKVLELFVLLRTFYSAPLLSTSGFVTSPCTQRGGTFPDYFHTIVLVPLYSEPCTYKTLK